MDFLLEAYGSSSDDESKKRSSDECSSRDLPPPDVMGMFTESEYDLSRERKQAEERTGYKQWVRKFPHERGNWPTHVFIPVPNSGTFVKMSKASVANFRQRLALAWKEHNGSVPVTGKKRGRDDCRTTKDVSSHEHKVKSKGSLPSDGPPEVIMNDMSLSGQQHLSLSKTVVLRAHQIEPFATALREATKTFRRFTLSIVRGYDVLVNEDKTRSFICLRVKGGRHLVLQLIRKVDPVMRKFKQPLYYEDPVIHVSVASVPGDISHIVGSSDGLRSDTDTLMGKIASAADANDEMSPNGDYEVEDDDAPSEVCVDVHVVSFKTGMTFKQAPLLPNK